MPWLFLSIAIVSEVIGTFALKAADGFTRGAPSVIVLAGYGIAFYCLSQAIRTIPVGIAYAIWSGAGIALTALVGWTMFRQTLDVPALLGLALIVSGVVVIGFYSSAVTH